MQLERKLFFQEDYVAGLPALYSRPAVLVPRHGEETGPDGDEQTGLSHERREGRNHEPYCFPLQHPFSLLSPDVTFSLLLS